MQFFTQDITYHKLSLSGVFLFRDGFRRGSVTPGTGLLDSLKTSEAWEDGTDGISYVTETSEVIV